MSSPEQPPGRHVAPVPLDAPEAHDSPESLEFTAPAVTRASRPAGHPAGHPPGHPPSHPPSHRPDLDGATGPEPWAEPGPTSPPTVERPRPDLRAHLAQPLQPGPAGPDGPADRSSTSPSVLASSAVMAAGTVVSRLSGFVRSALLAAALGVSLHADVFTIANTVPNMLYILLAGGVFNAVLVPQLVRSMSADADGGEAYTNRVVTVAALFLAVVTVVLVVLAPQLMSLYLDGRYDDPDRAEHLASVIAFARFCLPQVFFYGMFVLVGQILNARGRFGPMMWAPIANNVIAVAVLVVYLVVFSPARGAELTGPFSSGQELLLGLGSTAGIVVQLLILVPFLRRAGFSWRPRLDLRGSGLGHTFRLGIWTVLFVVVNQVAYTVVVRLASGGTADGGDGTGYFVYSSTFLIVMVPHAIVTVSLATAVLPRLSRHAAARDYPGLATELGGALRSVLLVVVPFAAVLPLVATDLAHVIWGFGAASDSYDAYVPSLALFGPGLVAFTVHYLVLRGFYALELTRTVFYVQCVIAVVNITAALVLVNRTDAEGTSPALVLAYLMSYAVGAALSYTVLRGKVGTLGTARTVRFVLQLLLTTAIATAIAFLASRLLAGIGDDPAWAVAAVRGGLVALVEVTAIVLVARLIGPTELTAAAGQVARLLGRRLRRRSAAGTAPR